MNYFSETESFTEEDLRNERDFLKYLKMLRVFTKKYCVIIAATNTPWGPALPQELSREVMTIGLNIDLFQKFRCPYAAVIDEGVLLFEKVETDTRNVIEENIKLDSNDEIFILSSGYDSIKTRSSIVTINGKNHSPISRGLHFVIFDKNSKEIIDEVAFDTYSNLDATRKNDDNKFFEDFKKNHPGVIFVQYNLPAFPSSGLTKYEEFLQVNKINSVHILGLLEKHVFEISMHYDDDTVREVFNVPKSYLDNIGVRRFEDYRGNHLRTEGGHRVTYYQPLPDGKNINVYVYGGCVTFGLGVADEHTIASFLQKMFNEWAPQYNVIVQNYGFFLRELEGISIEQKTNIINSLPLKPGDIVLDYIVYDNLLSSGHDVPKINMLDAASEPRNYEIFWDAIAHLNPYGNRLAAKKLYEGLVNQGIIDKARKLADERGNAVNTVSNNPTFDKETNLQLAEYKKKLKDYYDSNLKRTIGAVVMNCNPFTLGHRYLIEKALEQCSFLIIFVVEEDKSEFTFEERLKLVEEGTKDLSNVAVFPSGKFVLSSLTFSEYFNKSEMQDRVIDTSLDVTVFAREIAPCMNITKRFAGEEPLDNVTKQYNDSMRRILPEYGIEFVEIPRTEIDSRPISASRVRELAKSGRFSELKELVPQTTFDYLVEKYKQ